MRCFFGVTERRFTIIKNIIYHKIIGGCNMMSLVGWRALGLTPIEERRVQNTIDKHLHRISVLTGDVVDVRINVKTASKTGNSHRFEIMLSLATNDRIFNTRVSAWELIEAVHRAFVSIEHQVTSRVTRIRAPYREPVYPEVPVV